MLSYFKINDPYRLISIFILILLIRIPFFIGSVGISIPELSWLILGEKMASGATLYKEIWDYTGPLASGVYWILYEVFGRSYKVYHYFAIILILFQSYIFNDILQKNKAYKDYSFVPALIYILLYHLVSDLYTLSPLLMANTFIILAIHNLFKRIEVKSKDENIHNSGLYLGIASLFYFPIAILFFFVLLSFAFFTGMVPRRYMLSVYGFLLPFLLTWTYFIFRDASSEFYTCFLYSWIYIDSIAYLDFLGLLLLISPLLIVLFRAFINLFTARGFSNFQVRLQQAMFLMLVFCILIFSMAKMRTANQLLIFMVPISFFVSHYFLLLKRSRISEFKLILFLGAILFLNYSIQYGASWLDRVADFSRANVKETAWENEIRDKKILVLGNEFNAYFHSSLATPYLNWSLSRLHFENPEYYDNLDQIYRNFTQDPPEVIIDTSDVMESLFLFLPLLEERYEKKGENYYELISS